MAVAGLLVYNGDVYTPDRIVHDGAVLVSESHILAVGPRADVLALPPREAVQRVDARGGVIAPGFIDLQVNGAAGHLLTRDTADGVIDTVSATLAHYGCTAFLPTIITSSLEEMTAALRAIQRAMGHRPLGASILGAHAEGPFISPDRAGVHAANAIRLPSVDGLSRLWDASSGTLRLLTLAPELPGARDVMEEAQRLGIAMALGHTNATYEQATQAMEHGVRMVTHLFNAMGPFQARNPGVVGAALAHAGLSASVIADGIHVHPAALRAAFRAKGAQSLVLVTDAMPPVGTNARSFSLYDTTVEVKDGVCVMPDGRLAGSILTMDRAVRTMVSEVGVPLAEALAMATINPARAVGVDGAKGSLHPGKDADIVVLDRSLQTMTTVVAGRIVYQAGEGPSGDVG